MDLLAGLRISIDSFWYSIILSFAGLHWSVLRGFILMGYTIEVINRWLLESAFIPLIEQTNASLNVAVSFAFFIALLVLGLTYMLAAFIRLEVVNFRSALTWYIAGALFFSLGPALYRGMNDFRTTIAQGFYLSTLQGLDGQMDETFSPLNQVESNDLGLGPLCDYLGVYLPGAVGPSGIDGLDVALAYLRADGPDVMGYAPPAPTSGCPGHFFNPLTGEYISQVPQEWFMDDSYFDAATSPMNFDEMDDMERGASIAMASSSHSRMLTAWPLVLFSVVEQLVYLLITIAMGITFLSFGMAILFAFFKKTEVIAKSIVDQWIELIVQTVVIAMVQSLVVAFFLAGTASGNGMVALGIGLMCLVFMVIVLWSGVKAVWNALNRLFNAMGQATGGVLVTPGTAALTTASAGAAAAGGAVSVGSNALAGMTALHRGATLAQAAGLTLGGSQTLSGAARTLAYLPGARNTPLGEAAEQFTEGSITLTVARHIPGVGRVTGPLVGASLLSDRDPAAADYDESARVINRPMLVPAVGEGLERWTLPKGAQRRRGTSADTEFFEDSEGEMLPGNLAAGRPRRMGTFTLLQPASEVPSTAPQVTDTIESRRQQERSQYASEMQGEEMEQHLSDVMRTSTGIAAPLGAMLEGDEAGESSRLGQVAARLEASADLLARAAQMQMMVGQLKVSGVPDVAGVMGDVVGQVQSEREQRGSTQPVGLNHLQAAEHMAGVMGVTPQSDGGVPIQRDLARFGLFLDQALKLGLTPQQTEQVVKEVQSSPDGKLQPDTRALLDKQVQTTGGLSWVKARDEVDTLEHSARMLPQEITAVGAVRIPSDGNPQVTVAPQINVHVQTAANRDQDGNASMNSHSALSGSHGIIRGEQ